MRVLLDCRMASWTGVGRYTVGLARALAVRGDLDLMLVVAQGERPPVMPRDGARSFVAKLHPFSFGGAREFSHLIDESQPDVTHCPHFPTPVPERHPLVVTMHDLAPLLVSGLMPSVVKRAVYRSRTSRAVKAADRIVTLSHFTESEVSRVLPRSKGKIRVIPAAADDFSEGPPGLLDPALGEIAHWPYVLSMGSTRPHKDLSTLLRAFVRLSADNPELRLLLVGADHREFIDTTLAGTSASVRNRIVFTGRVEDPQLRTLMAGARVFAFPSRYEGFGLPPLEAMALGAPVVVARAASLPEVVGDAALTFEPGDDSGCAASVARILDDPELRGELVAAGRERAAQFTWSRTADATVAVYADAVAAR